MWFKQDVKGRDLINEVLGRFESMIDDLERGVADCQAEIEGKRDLIRELQTDTMRLSTAVEKAESVSANLKKLLGS